MCVVQSELYAFHINRRHKYCSRIFLLVVVEGKYRSPDYCVTPILINEAFSIITKKIYNTIIG